ncbi:serine/threonine-protein phosphatase 6 regulatory ankyrin repeat subunit B-like [Haliotis cracherodii]|uniref:serine/threonine-protein phosphatase 6 regulatory ankyrin repeat subunit B-like n=1 Tax=Haliotis cracherodii TaxID=6455 RepID=UPI0039E9D8B0
MMSTSTESSEYPYQSDGEIPCCFTKGYDSTCSEDSEKNTPDTRDAWYPLPPDSFSEMDISCIINQIHGNDEPEDWVHVYPRGAELYLEPMIFNNIKNLARGNGNFVYVSSGLMKDLRILDKTRVPQSVICDICVFIPEKPVTLLTFVAKDNRLSDVYSYTSCLARAMTTALRRGSLASFQMVHGVVAPQIWRSSNTFSQSIEELVSAARRTAIPHSMDNSQSHCITALKQFLEMIKDNTAVRVGSSPPGSPEEDESSCMSPVITRAYEMTIDVLQKQRHAVVTGGPGEGKTTVAHMLCRLYQQRGYQTFFFQDFEEADLTIISEVKVPFLLVIDDMFKSENSVEHQSFLKSFEKHIEDNDVILVMVCQLYNFKKAQKMFQTYLLENGCAIDITEINSTGHRSTCVERYQLLQSMGVNVTSSELIKISNIKTYTPGFPAISNDFPTETRSDPIHYFSYPHRYIRGQICCLLHQSPCVAAALILLIINGGAIRRNSKVREELLEAIKTVCPGSSEETIFDELQFLSGSFLTTSDGFITFQNHVVYDACVFATASQYPEVLWNNCSIQYLSQVNWPLTELNTDILISKQNLHHFINDLGDRLRKRQFEMVLKSPLLASEENVDFLIACIGTNIGEVLNSVDVRRKGNLLYWTGHSRNHYMTQLLLRHSEMSSDIVQHALSTCICLQKTHVFSYLWNMLKHNLKNFDQSDIDRQDGNGQTLLYSSVRTAENDMVKFILKEGASPMVQDNMGSNSLHEACRLGKSDILRSLVAVKGTNINVKDRHSRTPLMIAALHGHYETFGILSCMEGCDKACVDHDGNHVLHLACLSGNKEIVQSILASVDVDVNQRGQDGKTPLMIATSEGHGDIFDVLINAGCQTDIDVSLVPTEQGIAKYRDNAVSKHQWKDGPVISKLADHQHAHGILHKLANNGHYQLLQFLLSKDTFNLDCTNSIGRTPVMTAVVAGHQAVYDLFVSKGCSLDVTDKDGCSILHLACKTGGHVLIEKIMKCQAIDVNCKDETNKSAVMHAVEGGHLEAFKLLRDKCDLLCIDNDGNSLLHLACIGGCIDIVELLVTSGRFDIDSRNQCGRTPAMVAAYAGHSEIYSDLKRRGCDLDKLDTKGFSCFCCACMGGNIDIVSDMLYHNRLFMHHRDTQGRTPTMHAAEHGHVKVMVFLLDNGGDVSEQDDNGNTLLHIACCTGNEGIVKAFLSGNTDINQRGHLGRTPIMMAAMKGHKRVFNLCLKQSCALSTKDYCGNNLLHAACIGGHIQIVQWLLLQNMFDINSRGESGKTPLMMAAERGYVEVFNLLVKEGCDHKLLDERSNTTLHVACASGNVIIVKYLLSHCSLEVDCRGQTGRTPAMCSAIGGHKQLLTHLVQTGAKLSLTDDDNNNIFHLACLGGSVEVCNLLLHLAIDVCDLASRGRNGRTPVMMAASKGHSGVFKLLISKGCKLSELDDNHDSILHLACLGGNVAIVQYLLLQGIVNLNSKGRHGRTPLMLAAWKGLTQVYFLLVSRGCDLTGEDEYGDNILHLACRGGRADIVEHLISLRLGDLESRGQYGRTPVMMAAGKGCKQVVDLLIDNRCDLTAVDSNGNTVLHLACLSGKAWFVKYLLSKATVDVLQENDSQLSPDSFARYCGQRDVLAMLQRCSHSA